MRRVFLSGTFLALVVALCALWAFRFERSPDLPTWRLADLRAAAPPMPGVEWIGPAENPTLRLSVDAQNPRIAARLAIPGVPAAEMLHIRYRIAAKGLEPGKETWEDGRFVVEWHPPGGGSDWETDPVGSISDDDRRHVQELVVHPINRPAIPALRLEHLGRSGEFEVAGVELTVIQERPLWKTGRWFLALGWFAWGVACIRSWPGISHWRAALASFAWLLMGIHFVIPGPWKIQHAIYPAFQLGAEPAGAPRPDDLAMKHQTGKSPLALTSGPLPALGEIPNQGGLALRVKLWLKPARPLLHVLLLLGPTLLLAWLVGRKPALFLVTTLAISIELAQTAFGYGFDWVDIIDLTCDAAGIALGLWLNERLHRFLPSKLGWVARLSHSGAKPSLPLQQ